MKIFVIIFAVSLNCAAQTYPRWFFDPVELKCGLTGSGYAQNYFQKGSSDSAAYLDACGNIARNHYIEIRGSEAYWETEAGVYWMGNDIKEKIDSVYLRETLSHAKKLADFSSRALTVLLVSNTDCTIPQTMLSEDEFPLEQPSWVESLPQGGGHIYAEGIAPDYFYEPSSWESAEKRARFNLARSMRVNLESLQKFEHSSGQDVRNEEVSAVLHDVEVVHRWRDISRGLYYVLMRMRSEY